MNKKLHEDWRQGQGLFANSILYCEEDYSIDTHLFILKIISEYLNLHLNESEIIFFLKDWHEHDGYISTEEIINKQKLTELLTNPKEILKKSDIDVYNLVYNFNEDFMLRWYSEKEDNEFYCDFALVLSNDLHLKKIEQKIKKFFNNGLKIENAERYFSKRYVGN